jgi:hypothetical protein
VGYVFQDGHWETRGGRHYWVEGTWVAGGGVNATVEVHDHRTVQPPVESHGTSYHGAGAGGHGASVVVRGYPVEAPPPPQVENPGTKAGFIWIEGHYAWENGAYVWKNGHWERPMARKKWNPGRWELQGDRYIFIEGGWIDAGVEVHDHRHH